MDPINSNETARAPQNRAAVLGQTEAEGSANPMTQSPTAPYRGGGRGRGRGRGVSSVHGQGGPPRAIKRAPSQLDDDDDDDIQYVKEKKIKMPEPQPVEIHRRHVSLRDRLIKGVTTPQNIGMRAYKQRKEAEAAAAAEAAAREAAQANARNPPREFLVPIMQSQSATQPATNAYSASANSSVNPPPIQPNYHIAYKSTPLDQLHFPEDLVLALKQNKSKWESKPHSEGVVFVVTRLVDGDLADMRVFTTLQDATLDALHMMVLEHPEAFAQRPPTDGEGNEVKPQRTERAVTVLRDLVARPDFMQIPRVLDQGSGSQYVGSRSADNQYSGTQYPGSQYTSTQHSGPQYSSPQYSSPQYSSPQYTGTRYASPLNNSQQPINRHNDDEDSLFVIKSEDPERPRPPRIAGPPTYLNDQGSFLLRDNPEPVYVFWGRHKMVSSSCLKLEARRVDGAAIKVSVHLKNLRKPGDIQGTATAAAAAATSSSGWS